MLEGNNHTMPNNNKKKTSQADRIKGEKKKQHKCVPWHTECNDDKPKPKHKNTRIHRAVNSM